MKQSILFNRQPLVINVQLAEKIGLNEAIFFQQVHYWLQKSIVQHDGVSYVYNTANDWIKQFPFWSESTIRRIVSALSERGLIVIKKLSDNKHDRTNYYTINYSHPDLYENEQNECDMIHPVKLTESKPSKRHDVHPVKLTESKPSKRHDVHPENTTENTTEIKDMSVSTKHDGSVSEIFAYWQSAMNSPRSKLGADKKKKILTALKTYSIEEIKKAILGCAMTPFNMGDNDRQTKYNGLELILRNSEKIDKFISHADNPPAARKQKPVIDNNDTSWGKDFGDIY